MIKDDSLSDNWLDKVYALTSWTKKTPSKVEFLSKTNLYVSSNNEFLLLTFRRHSFQSILLGVIFCHTTSGIQLGVSKITSTVCLLPTGKSCLNLGYTQVLKSILKYQRVLSVAITQEVFSRATNIFLSSVSFLQSRLSIFRIPVLGE